VRSTGNHGDSPMAQAVEMFNQLFNGMLILHANLAEPTRDQSVDQYGRHSILLEIGKGPAVFVAAGGKNDPINPVLM
jgi:hypothetical protein